ncbi:hypothetical protein, partial [Rhizobium laguerreae]|uniref:hypothetical protein n=1 Tax=Rhizobium laguerreae TaxID=1076926 RepID=UPI001C904AA5
RQQGADFAYERLIGTPAELSHNPGKFQLPLAQNRGAPQKPLELTSKWIISTGQGHVGDIS